MQYLGGKKRLAHKLVGVLGSFRQQDQRVIDMFCGSLPITAALAGRRHANDGCIPLITLYRAWLTGWRPEAVSEEDYKQIRARQDPNDPYTALAGFGLSYGGKWFGGYARDKKNGRDFLRTATKSLNRVLNACEGVTFSALDFDDVEVHPGDMVYCDPPYRGTTPYGYFDGFDVARFDLACERWARMGADVFVSEYVAPPNTEEVAAWSVRKSRLKGPQTERLFRWVGDR